MPLACILPTPIQKVKPTCLYLKTDLDKPDKTDIHILLRVKFYSSNRSKKGDQIGNMCFEDVPHPRTVQSDSVIPNNSLLSSTQYAGDLVVLNLGHTQA